MKKNHKPRASKQIPLPLQKKRKEVDQLIIDDLGDARDDLSEESLKAKDIDEDDLLDNQIQNDRVIANFEEEFCDILDNEDVEDAVDLNEKFLSKHLGVSSEELAKLEKIELKVDTSCHNLQVTGEILCSLQYLKMNDSIIKCFRDIGTSFKFVRVLHLARCQLKEVQGIQAFEHLEELYISYNEIEELFDIGFLEYLNVLDLEGNNVKSVDQLYYLKRCTYLADLNLKYNPVTVETEYYQTLKECVPRIETLDEEIVDFDFFERKEDQVKVNVSRVQASMIKTEEEIHKSDLLQRFCKLGIKEETLIKWSQEGLDVLDQEVDDEQLLVKTIKSQSKEKKAQQAIEEFNRQNTLDFQRPSTSEHQAIFGRTFSQNRDFMQNGRKALADQINGGARIGSKMGRTTTNSFFKGASSTLASSKAGTGTPGDTLQSMKFFQRSSSNAQQDHESGVSDLVSNTDQVMSGSAFSILRRREEKKRQMPIFSMNTDSGTVLPKDIYSLINEFHSNIKSQISKEDIRAKMQGGSNTLFSRKDSLNNCDGAHRQTGSIGDPYQHQQMTQSLNQRKKVKTAFTSNSASGRSGKIVLKQSDISFSQSYKKQ